MEYTYNGIKAEIETRLSLLSNWNKILYYGVYQRIVDLLAYTGEKLVYLAEFLYRESKWITAEKRDSLVKMARWLGYIPYRKTGASGTLIVSADPTFQSLYSYTGGEIRIPRWHRFTNADDNIYIYCTENTFYYTGTVGNLEVPVKQGIPKEYTYTASGIINEKIYIYSESIDNNEIQVQIVDSNNNFLYEVNITTNLYLINNTDDYYCQIENGADNTYIYIQFGDGINSKKLSTGEKVLIKYADTLGSTGDINSTSIVTVIKDYLYDENNDVVTLYVNNTEAITGGEEIEDIESIRNNAPNLFQAGMLLSSVENWQAVINSAPYVNKSKVWTAESLGSTLSSDQQIVYMAVVSNTGEDLTVTQKTSLLADYVTPKKCLTEIPQFENLSKIYARFVVDAKVSNSALSVVDTDIKTALNDRYDILNTDFQTNVYESNFYSTIDSVGDIVYHTTEVYYLEKDAPIIASNLELATSYTAIDTSNLDDQNYLVGDSFELWIKRKIANVWQDPTQVAVTSGINIIGTNGYTISGGYVSYTTNQYSYSVNEIVADTSHTIYGVEDPDDSDVLGYILYISYKMQDGNTTPAQQNSIRLPFFYQIMDIDVDFIDTNLTYMA
jgi:hypothetical protein